MHVFRIRMFPLAAGLALVLGACSGRDGGATAAAALAPMHRTGVSTGTGSDAVIIAAPDAGGMGAAAGDMQALVTKLPLPARNAIEATASFRWNGDAPEPVGALAAAQGAIEAAEMAAKARQQQVGRSTVATDGPMAADPAAMQKPPASMSDAQKVAYAMQLNRQMMQNMQARMQSAGALDTAALQDAQDTLDQASGKRFDPSAMMQAANRHAGIEADKARIRQQAKAAHAAIETSFRNAISRIPYQEEGEGGGGCFSAADAQRVQALQLQDAARHVAVADDELRGAMQWSLRAKAALQQAAREDDALVAKVSTDLARIHNPMLHSRIAVQLESARIDPGLYRNYWESVRDFDLDAAQWVRERDRQRAEGWRQMACDKA